jgi:riboflavin synthase
VFTGIIQAVGTIRSVDSERGGKAITVHHPELKHPLGEGDSVAMDGLCLTAESTDEGSFRAFLSGESLAVSKFGRTLRSGLPVNLESSLTLEDGLGGHLVTGHVDCTGTLRTAKPTGQSSAWTFEVHDAAFTKYLVHKGSVAVDGVSLTVARKTSSGFTVEFIHYTLKHTTFDKKRPGDLFNLEFDLFAKHIHEYLQSLKIH